MITSLNNRNVGQKTTIACPVCQRPMKGSSIVQNNRFYYCKPCQEQNDKDPGFLIIDVSIHKNDKEVWIRCMDLYFDEFNVRQDNMENISEYATTTIYHVPRKLGSTWTEIATFPMIEFDISDIERFKKKIRTYTTFS